MFRPNPTAGYQGFLNTGYHELSPLGLDILILNTGGLNLGNGLFENVQGDLMV